MKFRVPVYLGGTSNLGEGLAKRNQPHRSAALMVREACTESGEGPDANCPIEQQELLR